MKRMRPIAILLIVAVVTSSVFALEKRTAQIASLNGTAEVRLAGKSEWIPAALGMTLNEGDTLKTAPKSTAVLDIDQGKVGVIEMKEGSQMLIAELTAIPETDTSKTLLDLAIGEVLVRAQKVHGEASKFEVKTPTSIVGVRGTIFNVKVEAVED